MNANTSLPFIAQVDELQGALTGEICHYLNWRRDGWWWRIFRPLLDLSLRRFTLLAASFDRMARQVGFCGAAREMLPDLISGLEARGVENIPPSGPLIIAANHPGTFDTLVAAACLPRDDFKTIARGMTFLRALPCASSFLIFSTRDVSVKMAAARAAVAHLKAGGALLLFPAGDLEPDPACLPGANDSLASWSASLELFLRRVPETRLQVAIMSRLLLPASLRHPLALLRKDPHQRQIAAEIVQVMEQMVFAKKSVLRPLITFGKALSPGQLLVESEDGMMPGILQQARSLLSGHTARPDAAAHYRDGYNRRDLARAIRTSAI